MKIRTLRESTYFQPVKLAGVVAAPNDIFPAAPDWIDASDYHGIAFYGTLRVGDAPVVEVVAGTDSSGSNLKVIATLDLSAETVADGDAFMIDFATSCLGGCEGYQYIALRFTTPDVSGDTLFIGYDAAFEPVTPVEYVVTACKCCCDEEVA